MPKQYLNPSGIPNLPGFSQVTTGRDGTFVFISGQVAFNERNEIIGRGDLAGQMVQTFENLGGALKGVGATFDDVLKTTIYVVDYNPEQIGVIREVRGRFLTGDRPPASTLIGVQALAFDGLLVEIEAVAMIENCTT